MPPLNLNALFSKYPADKVGSYLRHRFEDPANIEEFACLFTNHIKSKIPEFHSQILSEYVRGGKVAVVAPRGFAKSTITDVVGASYFALNGKYHFILIISDTYTQAKLQLNAMKNEIETNDMIKLIYPDAIGEVWGEDRIMLHTAHGDVLVMALGAGMKIRGLKFRNYRPELVIIDDLENLEIVYSEERRNKLERWFNYDLLPSLQKGNANIIYIGTILHYAALLRKVISKEGRYASWRTLFFKAIKEDGTSLWPQIYPTSLLMAMRDDPNCEMYVGSLVFMQEYQNEPQDDKERIFKVEWLSNRYKLFEVRKKWEEDHPGTTWDEAYIKKIIIGVDPAISTSQAADSFAMIVVGIGVDGHIWILDYFKEKIGDPLVQVNAMLDMHLSWKSDKVRVEVIAYQKGLYNLVRNIGAQRGVYPPLEPVKTDIDKVRRARIHSANFSGGLVHIREDHPLFNAFFDEVVQFPMAAHDDMLDAYMMAAQDTIAGTRPRVFATKSKIFG